MGGADVRNAGLWNGSDQHASGMAQFNKPGGRGVFATGKKKFRFYLSECFPTHPDLWE